MINPYDLRPEDFAPGGWRGGPKAATEPWPADRIVSTLVEHLQEWGVSATEAVDYSRGEWDQIGVDCAIEGDVSDAIAARVVCCLLQQEIKERR